MMGSPPSSLRGERVREMLELEPHVRNQALDWILKQMEESYQLQLALALLFWTEATYAYLRRRSKLSESRVGRVYDFPKFS
ncbi:hypothetical protein HID58_070850 [Brassica napus]|uniref:BnaC06g12180D protein n=3 Tax=Brassica TaxID=3705 RepID=A0A078GP91_BRANA|nr:hypothetical protein HID58_070850 [Brassica napus]CAF2057644.1 unnamed protein product [Brassica napus]CDY27002.1 BnaC06g12180D [Brassica napus]VDD61523.1 unnamed protein product [Brassica oleracea]